MKYFERDEDDQIGYEDYEDVIGYTSENVFYGCSLGAELLSEISVLTIWEWHHKLLPSGLLKVKFSSGIVAYDADLENMSDYVCEVPGVLQEY